MRYLLRSLLIDQYCTPIFNLSYSPTFYDHSFRTDQRTKGPKNQADTIKAVELCAYLWPFQSLPVLCPLSFYLKKYLNLRKSLDPEKSA